MGGYRFTDGRFKKMWSKGFSYPEILLTITLMALVLAPTLHSLVPPSSASQEDGYLVLLKARAQMEKILSDDFSAVLLGSSLSKTVKINGRERQMHVNIAFYDINGDASAETDVKKITVHIDEVQLEALKLAP